MNISEKGKAFIKSFEGCILTSYRCPAGVWTIGYGRTSEIKEGMTITKQQADLFFDEDIKRYEAAVQKYTWLNQNQFDSLCSFAFNCGNGALASVMASGNITEEMFKYNKAGGAVLQGLVRRRKEEIELFNTPTYQADLSEYEVKRWNEKGVATFLQTVGIYNNFTDTISVDQYYKGEKVYYDLVVESNLYRYISYISRSGQRRFVPIYRKIDKTYRATFV